MQPGEDTGRDGRRQGRRGGADGGGRGRKEPGDAAGRGRRGDTRGRGPVGERRSDDAGGRDDRRGTGGGGAGRRRGEPAGLDRAVQRSDAPPRRAQTRPGSRPKTTPEPPLAADAPVDVAKGIRRDVQRATTDEATATRVLQHLTLALAALDARDGATALPHLQWVKGRLPRLVPVREALGVALYLEEDYRSALSELAAHRRLTGSVAHNHLVADSYRALGENEHRIPSLVEAMEEDAEVEESARVEGRIVWASWLADGGDIGAARAALAPALDDEPTVVEEHHLRAWYVAGDLAARAGDDREAVRWFGAVAASSEGFFDTADRLERLTDR